MGMPKGKRPFQRPRKRWENTTKIDLKETGYENVDWLHLALEEGQVAGCCEYSVDASVSMTCRELPKQLRTISFSQRTLLHGVSDLHAIEMGEEISTTTSAVECN